MLSVDFHAKMSRPLGIALLSVLTVASMLFSEPLRAVDRPNHRPMNLRLAGGGYFGLGDELERAGKGSAGGQGMIGVDGVLAGPFALSFVGGLSGLARGEEGTLEDLFAALGLRLRLLVDRSGALNESGGNALGHLWVDAHFGYHGYESEDHAGYDIGMGYELSIYSDFNLGPYGRFQHTPIGRGLGYASIALGIQLSFGVKLEPDDADKDGIEDLDDGCPTEREDRDGFEDEDGCPDRDNDDDGVPDDVDRCPKLAGVPTNSGCKENDNDHDGVLNEADRCPIDPEDKDGFRDRDGCPDNDNDRDELLDSVDKCPNKREDRDGFEDEDGCPDYDNDRDGLRDAADRCPLEPETVNGVDDEDGCPDLVRVKMDRIETLQRIHFAQTGAAILDRSFPVLEEVAEIIKLKPWIEVRIEAHTDARGGDKKNLALSKRRARAVVEFLVERGVEENRLAAEGLGEARPVADNNTKEGRAENNRIEFHILMARDSDEDSSVNRAVDPSADKAE